MRPIVHPRLRAALLGTCGASLAAALLSFCLAFTVPSPSRNLRPVLPTVDSLHTPIYISMTAAGLLLLSAVVAIASCLHGNRPIDLAACGGFLAAAVLSLTSLGLMAAGKSAAQTNLEASLTSSLKVYGPGNASLYEAWDVLQTDLACCGVRTNLAQDSYQDTPWYRLMREGNPHNAPKIPNSCCGAAARASPSQLAECTSTLPSVPAQNPHMHRLGCFEALMQLTEDFTVRYIILSIILLAASCGTLAVAAWHLTLLTRRHSAKSGGSAAPDRKSAMSSAAASERGGGYDNLAATGAGSLASLRSTSLAPPSAASLASGRSGRSPVASVYSGGGSSARTSTAASASAKSASSRPISERDRRSLAPAAGGQSNSSLASTTLTAQPIGGGRRRPPQPLANQKRPAPPKMPQPRPPQPPQPQPPQPHQAAQQQAQPQQQQQQRQTVTQNGKRESHF